jgi:hypothetical protein
MSRLLLLLALALHSQNDCAEPIERFGGIPPAYQEIAKQERVPMDLLFAIALQESGARLQSGRILPWPWTLNIAGAPCRYRTRIEAHDALRQALLRGQSVDVGLGQINWRYNADWLANDTWLAFDPYFNLTVAARIVRSYFEQSDRTYEAWWSAVGKYHSPGGKPDQRLRAQRYAQQVRSRRDNLANAGFTEQPSVW